MKVLVTGGAGFIGGYVCKELWKQGHEPLVFDIAAPIPQNVLNPMALESAFRHADACIHLAGILGNPETVADPLPAVHTNIIGSLNVFEAAGDKPVVFATVGNKWQHDRGTGGYTITKACVEDFVAMYNKCRGSRIAVVRPVNAYGPGQKVPLPWGDDVHPRKIMPTFIHQALHGPAIEVYGDGHQISDMVWVEDVARAFVAVIRSRRTWGCGPERSHTVWQVAKLVQSEVYRQTARFTPIIHIPMPKSEVPGITSVTEEQAVIPKVSLKTGIARTVASYL
ncbi:MAG: NAD-dependent epimerase/dehydratase family protein [Candidatus Methylomirabilales bacterium]